MPGYLLRRAWRNLRQNPFLCAATVATVAVALTLVALFGVVVGNLEQTARQWSRDLQIVIYLEPAPDAATAQRWQAEIARLPAVEQVEFVSSAEAIRRFRQRLGRDADLLDGLPADILPASLVVTVAEGQRHRAGVAALTAQLRSNPRFADLRDGQEWLERFDAFVLLLRVGAWILGGLLLLASLFVVANTIRLTLYARRDEVEVLALVGATPLVIRLPYVIEGMLHGAVGGVLALLGSRLLHTLLLERGVAGLLLPGGVDRLVFLPADGQVLLVALGAVMGLIGSLLALLRLGRS